MRVLLIAFGGFKDINQSAYNIVDIVHNRFEFSIWLEMIWLTLLSVKYWESLIIRIPNLKLMSRILL